MPIMSSIEGYFSYVLSALTAYRLGFDKIFVA